MLYRVEVIADDSGQWYGNGLRFNTAAEAEKYARALVCKWALARDWRVVEVTKMEVTK